LRGDDVNLTGTHFDVRSARLFDLPSEPLPLGLAVSGPQSCALAGAHADVMIAVEPNPELGEAFDAAGGAGKPRYGQMPISFDPDPDRARARAHEQFRWFAGGWKVNSELPGPSAFDAASQFVREEDVAAAIPCGADVDAVVKAVQPWREAGFTHLAFIQIGGDQQEPFRRWAEQELLPALRSA
jgi:G6PDH family F420-dependent oxidoreductase